MKRTSRSPRLAERSPVRKPGARADALADVAVLAIDGLATLHDRPFPREVALAFCGKHRGMAWLVQPEPMWSEPLTDAAAQPLGFGLHPAIVVREFAAACAGQRVFSELPLAAASWLDRLFRNCGLGSPCTVQDLRTLALRLNKQAPEEEAAERLERAGRLALTHYPGSERAATEAACHARFATLLAGEGN